MTMANISGIMMILCFVFCLICVTNGLLVEDNDHIILMQMRQEIDVLKAELAKVKAAQQKTQDKYHVAFMASLSHDLINVTVGTRIVFDKMHLNIGNGYNNRRGTFVAPQNGTYHFTLEITYPSTDPTHVHDAGVHLVKNSESIAFLFSDGIWQNWIRRSTTAIVELDTGDEVYAAVTSTRGNLNNIRGDVTWFFTKFSGFLIQ